MQVLVGRIGRPHGLKGGVTVEVRTDDPKARFAAGSVFETDPAEAGPLTVADSALRSGTWVLTFVGYPDRTAAEQLRNVQLLIDTESLDAPTDPDEFYDHQLIGLRAESLDGAALGTIEDVLHPPAAPVLVIRTPSGDEVLVPFVRAIVPTVDLAAGSVVIDPPDGMFDNAETGADAGAE